MSITRSSSIMPRAGVRKPHLTTSWRAWRTAATICAPPRGQHASLKALRARLNLVSNGQATEGASVDASTRLCYRGAVGIAGLMGLGRFPGASGRERVQHGLRCCCPTPIFSRWWRPLASRGRLGLIAAHVWRDAYLVS